MKLLQKMNYSRKTWYHDVLMRVINFILRHCTAYVGKKQITVFQCTQIYTATLLNKKQNTYTWIFIHLNEQKLKLIMLNLILVPLDALILLLADAFSYVGIYTYSCSIQLFVGHGMLSTWQLVKISVRSTSQTNTLLQAILLVRAMIANNSSNNSFKIKINIKALHPRCTATQQLHCFCSFFWRQQPRHFCHIEESESFAGNTNKSGQLTTCHTAGSDWIVLVRFSNDDDVNARSLLEIPMRVDSWQPAIQQEATELFSFAFLITTTSMQDLCWKYQREWTVDNLPHSRKQLNCSRSFF